MQNNNNSLVLTNENYFSCEAEHLYIGSSQFKSFLNCEARTMAELDGKFQKERSTALLVGSYVDAFFSGEIEEFTTTTPEIFKRDGSLKAEYKQADYIINRILKDEMFTAAVSGNMQSILTGKIEGVPVKIKVDSLLPDRTVDLKIMRDLADGYVGGERVPWWRVWRYDLQAALYQEIRRQNDKGELKPFCLAVATKESEPDLKLFEFSQPILDTALEEIKASIVYFDGLKKKLYEPTECGNCEWCRLNRKLTEWEIII